MSLQDGERRLAAIPSESTFLEVNTSATEQDKNCQEESLIAFGESISRDEYNDKCVRKFQTRLSSFPRPIAATETQSDWCNQALDLLAQFREKKPLGHRPMIEFSST
ncbi:hypothetical protein AC578_2538 [Pseudocercospora eumusae]|uniref:Uncharacterized protein n=1 Tax=Pseudocercospora eumusae TaxID=321146 RepID=A0A139GVT5_9PEZI|nr:hypothetical protein AC578_2538 [Pseudocercospora eumusae]